MRGVSLSVTEAERKLLLEEGSEKRFGKKRVESLVSAENSTIYVDAGMLELFKYLTYF